MNTSASEIFVGSSIAFGQFQANKWRYTKSNHRLLLRSQMSKQKGDELVNITNI